MKTAPSNFKYRLNTLGRVVLNRDDGTSLDPILSQPKRLALLVYLTISNRGAYCRRDTVLGVFWPEVSQERARAALRQALHVLRNELGDGVIVARGDDDVGVDSEVVSCDVHDFEAALRNDELETALDGYAGDFLDGFYIADAPEFERWVDGARRDLRDSASDTAARLTNGALKADDLRTAARWARKWTRLAPMDESATRALMTALGQAGERAGALEAYDGLVTRLGELELEPSPETQSMAARIRQNDVESSVEQKDAGKAASEPTLPPPSRRPVVAASAVIVIIAASTIGLVRLMTTSAADDRSTVTVTAFSNLTDDPEFESIGSVYQRAVADGLAQVARVRVLGTGDTATAPTLTVGGSFHRVGDSIEFATEIVDRARGRTLPAPPPVRVIAHDPAAGTRDVRRRAMAAIAYYTFAWHPADPARQPPDWDAYVTFEQGFHTMLGWVFGDRGSVARADSLFRRTIELDPLYTEAYLLLGAFVFGQQRPAVRRAAFSQRGRPVAMDSLAGAMRARVRPFTGLDRVVASHLESYARADYTSMLGWALEGAELLPQQLSPAILHPAGASNRPEVALARARTTSYEGWAFDLWVSWFWLAAAFHLAGDYEGEAEAVDSARTRRYLRYDFPVERLRAQIALGNVDRVRQLTQNLNFDLAHFGGLELRAHGLERNDGQLLAESDRLLRWISVWYDEVPDAWFRKLLSYWALSLQGRLDELVTNLEGMTRDSTHLLDVKAMLGVAYARQGNGAAADSIDRILAAADPFGLRGLLSLWRARIAAQLGAKERAVRLLDRAFREGTWFQPNFPVDGGFWHSDPDFEPLRGFPPYERLIAPKS